MLTASCHCGAVRIEIPHAPRTLTECNCSICFRRSEYFLVQFAVARRARIADTTRTGRAWQPPDAGIGLQRG